MSHILKSNITPNFLLSVNVYLVQNQDFLGVSTYKVLLLAKYNLSDTEIVILEGDLWVYLCIFTGIVSLLLLFGSVLVITTGRTGVKFDVK